MCVVVFIHPFASRIGAGILIFENQRVIHPSVREGCVERTNERTDGRTETMGDEGTAPSESLTTIAPLQLRFEDISVHSGVFGPSRTR